MNRKGTLILVAVLILVVIFVGWLYIDYRSAPQVQAPNPPVSTSTPSQGNFAEKIIQDWTAISAKIPLKAGESGRWYVDNIRTIGPSAALIAFEDGLHGNGAVVTHNGSDYVVNKVYEGMMRFTQTELDAIQKEFGDPSFVPVNYERSEGDGHLIPGSTTMFLATPSATTKIKIAWLNPEQNLPNEVKPGDISGCDNVVLQERLVPQTQAPLTAALKELLADKSNTTPGSAFYNYIGKGNLQLASVSIVNGTAKIYLTGTPPSLGGVCDDPRLFVQVAQTARQFPTVQKVELYVNGQRNDGSSNLQG